MRSMIRYAVLMSPFLWAPALVGAGGATDPADAIARYDAAWRARDAAALKDVIGAEYVYFTSRGGQWSRARWLEFMLSPKYELAEARRSEIEVRVTGYTAVASTRWIGHGRYDGKAFDDDQRCSLTLGRGADGWQILSEHCTQIVPR